jgi:hypothetical protein
MNALSLVKRVARRNPSYDSSEYLDEVNAAYKETWDYILQLEDSYFTDTKVVTVTTQAAEFDLIANQNGFLSAAISFRLFQIDRIRILQPRDVNWTPAHPKNWNEPEFVGQQQLTPQPPATASPYVYQLFSKGSILFGRPLPIGVQIEVVYTFIFLPLVMLSSGTVVTSTNTVTGTNTNFTQIVAADYQLGLPGNDQDTDVGVEIVLDPTGQQTYRVKAITSDTALTTLNAIVPAIGTGAAYTLASVPDIPDGHHNVISTLATRNIMSTPGNDQRFTTWAALAEKELDAMRDSIMTRQRQEPARRRRFPQSILRYTVLPSQR